jgi:hypothetical protein
MSATTKTNNVQMMFPLSRVQAFRKIHPELRYGQEFHQYMGLEKCEQDRDFCDRLYNVSDDVARKMIDSRTDPNS